VISRFRYGVPNIYFLGCVPAPRLQTYLGHTYGVLLHGRATRTYQALHYTALSPSPSAQGHMNSLKWACSERGYLVARKDLPALHSLFFG
jgi:hypothetical protein